MNASPIAEVSDKNVQPTETSMTDLYPFAAIRVIRIARDTNKKIGDIQLTAEVAQQLDEDQVGVLIANCGHPDQIHEKLLKLAETVHQQR